MAHGIQHYDADNGRLYFICPVCQRERAYGHSAMKLTKHHPTERQLWSLGVGPCVCGSTHFLNCALADDHPHAEAVASLISKL
jgi:hypothetical protein